MSAVELRHYAGKPFNLDRSRSVAQLRDMKPRGFWVTVPGEDDWPTWCRGQEWGLERLVVEYCVELGTEANILTLSTSQAILGFHAAYSRSRWEISWAEVAEAYDGILISPHDYSLRWDLSWYSGWDCASGCIWNLAAIESLDLVSQSVTS